MALKGFTFCLLCSRLICCKVFWRLDFVACAICIEIYLHISIFVYRYMRRCVGWVLSVYRWAYAGARETGTSISLSIQFGLIWFYGISTLIGYSMSNPIYIYIYIVFSWVGFYGISAILGYLMPNPLYIYIYIYIYILNIYDLV